MARTCDTCKFCSVIDNECRYNPPMAVPIPDGMSGKVKIFGFFPASNNRWCGKYEPKIELEAVS